MDTKQPRKSLCSLRMSNIRIQPNLPRYWWNKSADSAIGRSRRELSRVFSEDYDVAEMNILDPRGLVMNRWNKIFLVACLVSLFVDPLFFYLPEARTDFCINISIPLEVTLTIVRSVVDAFYAFQILVKFRTAFVAPSSRVFGRGELILDRAKISSRYLKSGFCPDLIAALPLPQVYTFLPSKLY